jgi:hypothetical protein
MEESSNEMENLLAGYSDTLQFILQFLHTEGFQESEKTLLQEIEGRLPLLLDEKISAGAMDSRAVPNMIMPEQVFGVVRKRSLLYTANILS